MTSKEICLFYSTQRPVSRYVTVTVFIIDLLWILNVTNKFFLLFLRNYVLRHRFITSYVTALTLKRKWTRAERKCSVSCQEAATLLQVVRACLLRTWAQTTLQSSCLKLKPRRVLKQPRVCFGKSSRKVLTEPARAPPVLRGSSIMAVRASFEKNNEVGCFAKLTNTYCLVAIGGSENFYRWAGHLSGSWNVTVGVDRQTWSVGEFVPELWLKGSRGGFNSEPGRAENWVRVDVFRTF